MPGKQGKYLDIELGREVEGKFYTCTVCPVSRPWRILCKRRIVRGGGLLTSIDRSVVVARLFVIGYEYI